MCHHVGFSLFNSFMLFMFFRSKEDYNAALALRARHNYNSTSNGKKAENEVNSKCREQSPSSKERHLNKSQKLHILEGWGVFEFLSFLVRQLNSNESGRATPANCARRVADLDVYSNDHRSTSECKLLYAST